MITISKNDYITTDGSNDSFTVNIKSFPKTHNNYFIESLRAAEEIYSNKQGKLHILYSGGVDSEYALSVFLSLGMDVTPVIVKMAPSYNEHDLKYAFDFCYEKKLKPVVIDIDFEEFVNSGKILDIAKSMKSCVYHYSTTAHAISKLDGTVICGDGEPYIKRNDDGTWSVTFYEYDYSLVNYFTNNGIYGTPRFSTYRPEMIPSFLKNPRMRELAENKHQGKLGSNSSKVLIYNSVSNFKLKIRPKYHGFELIENLDIFKNEIFKEFDSLPWTGVYSEDYYQFLNRYM